MIRKELLSILDRFAGTPILVVGDLIVDHYIWGNVERISPEAPVVVVQVAEENKRLGGAANVANNLVTLGAKVSMCGIVGSDDAGRELISILEKDGVDTKGVLLDSSRPTTVKTRVIAHSQQVVRIDRENAKVLSPTLQDQIAACFQSKLASCKGAIVSDYAKGAVCPAIFNQIEEGYQQGVLGLGKIPVLVDPKMPNFSLYKRSTVIKPNRKEAQEASGMEIKTRSDAVAAGVKLLDRWNSEIVMITLGSMGMVLVSATEGDEAEIEIDTVARDVYDVSGAGDTVSAVFVLAQAVGASPHQAAMLANYAAGIVVGEVGTVPVYLDDLKHALGKD